MLDLFFSQKQIRQFYSLPRRQLLVQLTNAAYSLMSTYMLWKAVGLVLQNDAPIVVVLSESMYPGFTRGDILFLSPKDYEEYIPGDMVVFQVKKGEIPIVHRCIKRLDGNILTKGDNNQVDDVGLYRRNQRFLTKNDVLARVIANLPFFGSFTIWINSIPGLRIATMILISLGVFFSREE